MQFDTQAWGYLNRNVVSECFGYRHEFCEQINNWYFDEMVVWNFWTPRQFPLFAHFDLACF